LKKRQAQQELMNDTESALTVFRVFCDKIEKQSQLTSIEIPDLPENVIKKDTFEKKAKESLDEIILVSHFFSSV
jgi:hypothetical protein